MTVQTFFKGLLMLLISVVVTAFSQVPVNYGFLIATAVASILGYIGANLTTLLNSTSEPGKLNWGDILGALAVALSTAITESIALIVIDGQFLLPIFLKVVGAAVLTYIAGTLFAGPKAKSKRLLA